MLAPTFIYKNEAISTGKKREDLGYIGERDPIQRAKETLSTSTEVVLSHEAEGYLSL